MTVQSKANAAAQLEKFVEANLGEAQQILDQLLAVTGSRTVDNTLRLYDEIVRCVEAAAHLPALLERVHPDGTVRSVAETATQTVDKFATELSLHKGVYEALAAIDAPDADAATRHYLQKTLKEYKRAGVDRDEETRNKVRTLQEELTVIGQDFARNIQSDTRGIMVDPQDLEGLPQDYIESHPADGDGKIRISTDYPDYVPFMSYSKSEAARKQLYIAFRNRAHPGNIEVLDKMIAKRHELAQLLGYENWAAFVTENKMIGSAQAAMDFVQDIAKISAQRAQSDYDKLLQYKRKDQPDATIVNDWEKAYYDEIVKSTEYQFDSQAVRPYFPYERVKRGVFETTARLFGVEYRRVEDANVWHQDVETYDILENGESIGRFHLDMHPRDDKYKHAAQFTIKNGYRDKQLPEAALVCNFPKPNGEDHGLMEHRDVETFFHEFGHLLHTIFAGKQQWIGIGGISTEWDFVEAPSQMLEEWALDPKVLQTFAWHYQTDEPIPAELVEKLRRAEQFGRGSFVRQQMFYAMLSLMLYSKKPEDVDPEKLTVELQNEYSPFRYVEGTHFHLSFGHLDGYSAIYYTYMWSLVIAKDLFSKFNKGDLLESNVPRQYRQCVLSAGGSAPAAELVKAFLGRDYGFEAYRQWLDQGSS